MSHLQTIHLEHLPPNYDLHIALYRNVTNAAFLHQQLLAGNTDFEYALIDASVVCLPHPLYSWHTSSKPRQADALCRPAKNLWRDSHVILLPPTTLFHVLLSTQCSENCTSAKTNKIQILSKVHILAAAYRAVNDLLENRLRSRNVHSEIVFSLSPNNNVRHIPLSFFSIFFHRTPSSLSQLPSIVKPNQYSLSS